MDESSFLRRIHENRGDTQVRSEYREWLEKQGNPRVLYMELMARRTDAEESLTQIDAKLADLVPKVGPHWITALFPKPGKNPFVGGYTLYDGREVQIESIQQSFTYSGLFEGLPTDKMNCRIIDRLLQEERHRGGEPYLVPPQVQPIKYQRDEPYPFGNPERLPHITCVSRLYSRQPARDAAKDYSGLCVICFRMNSRFPSKQPSSRAF